MKITKQSHILMSFFANNNCIKNIKHFKQNKTTNNILKNLFLELRNGFSYIQSVKEQLKDRFYKLKIKNIQSISQIAKPTTFPVDGFPANIRKQIEDFSLNSLTFSFQLFNRNITIIFLIEDVNPEMHLDTYTKYVDCMLVWLYIINEYASSNCSGKLTLYIYHTSLTKELPSSNINILNEENINTGFTTTCPKESEIVIYRKEEWFKVFLHETIHNFGLDFSDMNNHHCKTKILELMPVTSDVNLYESYTEFWARLMNVAFCSYLSLNDKNDVSNFFNNVTFFMNFEIMYSFFQMVKVLDFMDLTYKNLYEKGGYSEHMRNTFYKEKTNVLAYYIITLILIYNYQDFLQWCQTNNTSLLQFKKTLSNQESLCIFIKKKYKSKKLLDDIECTQELFTKVKKNKSKMKYLLNNLRMTICELG